MKIRALCIDGIYRIADSLKGTSEIRGRVSFKNVKTKGQIVLATWHGLKRHVFIREDTQDAYTFFNKGFRFR